ncbi:hypothetical protein [Clostridium sp.]|uniref:hypothetical protein n=1 Tax=Clostridium sp. TaxID=1506 RepID=UPI003F332F69
MKKLIVSILAAITLTFTYTAKAITNLEPTSALPHAMTYKEGIYTFDKNPGKLVEVDVINPQKEINMMVIETMTKQLKYYINFDRDCWSTKFYLDKPGMFYTVVIIGEGEVAIRFSN